MKKGVEKFIGYSYTKYLRNQREIYCCTLKIPKGHQQQKSTIQSV